MTGTTVSDKDDPLLQVHAKRGDNQSCDQHSLGSVGLVVTCDKGNFLQHINVLFNFAFLNMELPTSLGHPSGERFKLLQKVYTEELTCNL